MSISHLFERLGAPLRNVRWSWGAVTATGDVYLKVWTDELVTKDGKRWARLTRHSAFADRPGNLGWLERKKHVSMVEQGARSYALLCRAEDPQAETRTIASFDNRSLFVGGSVLTDPEGDHWLELVERRRL